MKSRDRSAATSAASISLVPALPSGWQAVNHAVLSDGTLSVLAADVDLAGEHQRFYAAMRQGSGLPPPPSRVPELCSIGTAQIWTLAAMEEWTAGPTFPLETAFPLHDRFSDGRWLVVASRSDGGAEARVLSPNGAITARLTLGDGIEHVAIDAKDRIWVGWFDEGIFGNDKWRLAGHRWPPSGNGVACFADNGTLLPLPTWPTSADSIADCYAMNAVGSGVWVCPYTDFPLVHFAQEEPARWWRSDIAGPKAVAVEDRHALLAGGYAKEANRLVLVSLPGAGNGEQASVQRSFRLPLRRRESAENGPQVWDHPSLLAGRGNMLHLIDDGVWYRWRVRNLISS